MKKLFSSLALATTLALTATAAFADAKPTVVAFKRQLPTEDVLGIQRAGMDHGWHGRR